MAILSPVNAEFAKGESTFDITPSEVNISRNGDKFLNHGKTIVRVRSTNHMNAPTNFCVFANAVNPCNQGHMHDAVMDVAKNTFEEFGPFPIGRFNDDAGYVNLTYSGRRDDKTRAPNQGTASQVFVEVIQL